MLLASAPSQVVMKYLSCGKIVALTSDFAQGSTTHLIMLHGRFAHLYAIRPCSFDLEKVNTPFTPIQQHARVHQLVYKMQNAFAQSLTSATENQKRETAELSYREKRSVELHALLNNTKKALARSLDPKSHAEAESVSPPLQLA